MPDLRRQYAKALHHNKRVRFYRWFLLFAAGAIAIVFASITAYPYIQRRLIPQFVINKVLLARLQKSSVMSNAILKDFNKGVELYSLTVGQAIQDYNNKDITKLQDLRGRFALAHGGWLDIVTQSGVYDAKARLFTLPSSINMQLQNKGEQTSVILPSAVIDIGNSSLRSSGGIKLSNHILTAQAHDLTVTNRGEDILLHDMVQVDVNDKKHGKITITSHKLTLQPLLQLLVFKEHVVANMGSDLIKTDMLQLHYIKGDNTTAGAKAGAKASIAGEVDKILASGHVYLKHNGDVAKGCKLQMNVKKGTTQLESCAEQASINLGN